MDETLPTMDPDPAAQDATGGVRAHSAFVPTKSDDVLELDLGDGIVLYSGDSTLVHHLNPAAAIVWHLCTGEATVAELARDIAEEYNLDPVATEDQVAGVIGELDTLGLLRDSRTGQREEPPAPDAGLS